jgi:hypothetical protein
MESQGKRARWLAVVGALLGAVLSTWIAPKMIAWYFSPPANMGINCVDPIQWALGKLQIAQIVGVVLGALLGLVAYFLRFRQRPAASAAGV